MKEERFKGEMIMKTSNVSEPIFSNSTGWFRYNYDENRLEFLNHNTKLVVHTWDIPADQWEALPSQQEYCENIIKKEEQKQSATKSRALTTLIISSIIAVVCWFLVFTGIGKAIIGTNICFYIIGCCATFESASSFYKYKLD